MSEARELNTQGAEEDVEGLDEADEAGFNATAILSTARQQVTGVITAHPVLSLVGAFAVGFALARIVKALGED